ncbi:unnamed protein product [Vitrella brassicaformis CCMP3155]|uniref:Uncharacterized protein n=1 Tax=Vitrella brassicaformis (strain CCMP3155) TaxID=1169540 RepID=A0A0G4ETA1_VITBC|nr:unnamed protein product [Vitrella brassicaformis CCMP3155]|eukprot:CEM01534.1 unnamed protein product [Vitrella brassicaformis CCMP3155]
MQTPHNYKTQVCTFHQKGQCTKGKDCTYAHGPKDLMRPGSHHHRHHAAPDYDHRKASLPSDVHRKVVALIRKAPPPGMNLAMLRNIWREEYSTDLEAREFGFEKLSQLVYSIPEVDSHRDSHTDAVMLTIKRIAGSSVDNTGGGGPASHNEHPSKPPPYLDQLLEKGKLKEYGISEEASKIDPEALLLKDASDLFHCVICNSLAFRPKLTRCLHLFCADCLDTWFDKQCNSVEVRAWADVARQGRKKSAPCPFCKEDLSKETDMELLSPQSTGLRGEYWKVYRELEIRCRHADCSWQGPLFHYFCHLVKCKHEDPSHIGDNTWQPRSQLVEQQKKELEQRADEYRERHTKALEELNHKIQKEREKRRAVQEAKAEQEKAKQQLHQQQMQAAQQQQQQPALVTEAANGSGNGTALVQQLNQDNCTHDAGLLVEVVLRNDAGWSYGRLVHIDQDQFVVTDTGGWFPDYLLDTILGPATGVAVYLQPSPEVQRSGAFQQQQEQEPEQHQQQQQQGNTATADTNTENVMLRTHAKRVVWDYTAPNDITSNCISVRQGDWVVVIRSDSSGWSYGRRITDTNDISRGPQGWFATGVLEEAQSG